jgi:hypothetical protein
MDESADDVAMEGERGEENNGEVRGSEGEIDDGDGARMTCDVETAATQNGIEQQQQSRGEKKNGPLESDVQRSARDMHRVEEGTVDNDNIEQAAGMESPGTDGNGRIKVSIDGQQRQADKGGQRAHQTSDRANGELAQAGLGQGSTGGSIRAREGNSDGREGAGGGGPRIAETGGRGLLEKINWGGHPRQKGQGDKGGARQSQDVRTLSGTPRMYSSTPMELDGVSSTASNSAPTMSTMLQGEMLGEPTLEPLNITSPDVHITMQRIRDQESFTLDTKWLVIHGFHQGMTDEQVLHAANTICANMQLQMNNADILEAMEHMTGWQMIELEGTFGICIELTETPSFIISYDYGMDPAVQPFYSNRFGPNMMEGQGREHRLKYHVQASIHPPSFYQQGLKELIVFRGASSSEEHTRPWLHMITEYCKHQFAWPHVVLMRTTSNKTPIYDLNTAKPGDKMQYLKEPIATLYCVKTNFKDDTATRQR